jgi:hypothetical protein
MLLKQMSLFDLNLIFHGRAREFDPIVRSACLLALEVLWRMDRSADCMAWHVGVHLSSDMSWHRFLPYPQHIIYIYSILYMYIFTIHNIYMHM